MLDVVRVLVELADLGEQTVHPCEGVAALLVAVTVGFVRHHLHIPKAHVGVNLWEHRPALGRTFEARAHAIHLYHLAKVCQVLGRIWQCQHPAEQRVLVGVVEVGFHHDNVPVDHRRGWFGLAWLTLHHLGSGFVIHEDAVHRCQVAQRLWVLLSVVLHDELHGVATCATTEALVVIAASIDDE